MTYAYEFASNIAGDVEAAFQRYLCYRPRADGLEFISLIDEAFEPLLRFPELTPATAIRGVEGEVRRVNIWHFAFFYRVQPKTGVLLIVAVIHERSAVL